MLRRAEGVAKLQQTRPDLFGPANLDQNQYHYNQVLGLPAGGAEQVRDKLQSVVADSVTDQKIDNLVGVDGKKLATTNKLFEDRLHGIGNQIRTALTRICDTVAARVSQATTKSSDMSQQPGMSPG